MTKELLEIEFRYSVKVKDNDENETTDYKNKFITIGIFDTLEEAIIKGNECIAILAKTFEVRSNDKFQKNWLFGQPMRLVTNCSYKDPISFFAKITKLNFDDLNDTINSIITETKK